MTHFINDGSYCKTENFQESYDLFDELDDFYEPEYDEEMY